MWYPDGTIIRATVGSTAYGLAREGSDVDTLGVFVAPTRAYWSLSHPRETYHSTVHDGADHDYTYHEVAKYLSLALKCNPSLLELLYLPLDLYSILAPEGQALRAIRESFLSTPYVRNAFGGYAQQQLSRLVRRNAEGKEGFSADTAKRTAKHARHCFRLIRQGRQLLTTGSMDVRVPDPSTYWAFDHYTVDEIVREFTEEDLKFQQAVSVLPPEPDFRTVESFLIDLRERHLDRVTT